MQAKMTIFAALTFVSSASAAIAETCTLHSLDTANGSPRSVRVVDEDTGNLVYNGLVGGGQDITITVSNDRGRYTYKYPLDRDFHSDTGFYCKNGETTNF